jgi:hypothetical protein
MWHSVLILSLPASLLAGSAGAEPRLELLGVLPENKAENRYDPGMSLADAVSADGCTLVGHSVGPPGYIDPIPPSCRRFSG